MMLADTGQLTAEIKGQLCMCFTVTSQGGWTNSALKKKSLCEYMFVSVPV